MAYFLKIGLPIHTWHKGSRVHHVVFQDKEDSAGVT